MSDTLGSPTFSRKSSIRRSPSVRRKSNTWLVTEDSWEDDVDYIYDNALEAECDFDWDCTAEDGSRFEDREQKPREQKPEEQIQSQNPISVYHRRREQAQIAEEEGPLRTRYVTPGYKVSTGEAEVLPR
jgi:hypothetical protein